MKQSKFLLQLITILLTLLPMVATGQTAEEYKKSGFSKMKLGHYKEAIDDYTLAININPKDHHAYYQRAILKDYLGLYDDALQDINQAIAIFRIKRYYLARGDLKIKLKLYEDALISFKEIPKFYFPDADIYYGIGVSYHYLGRYEEAITEFNQALLIDSKHALSYNGRGVSKQLLGLKNEALADYKKAMEYNPFLDFAFSNRAILNKELGNFEEAIKEFSRAIRLSNNDVYLFVQRAECHYKLNLLKEAEQDLLKALAIKPEYSDALAIYGLIYEKVKKTEMACKKWNKSLEFKFYDTKLQQEIIEKIASLCQP